MKLLLLPVLMVNLAITAHSQLPHTLNPVNAATALFESLDEGQRSAYSHSFDDPKRKTWDRLPGKREGLKIANLTEKQKTLFHSFLRSSLSSEGYLMITAIMFNEDIQQRFEPYLGRNEYYIELFGMPGGGGFWGWQLEGHHLSLNLTFRGNELISQTPFLLASNPQVVNSDRDRNGLSLIYLEESLAGALAESLDGSAREQGYTHEKRPSNVYAETRKGELSAPEDGVPLSQLNKIQQTTVKKLANSYLRYFRLTDARLESLSKQLTSGATKFYFMQNTPFNEEHYYRLHNPSQLIECENYGNHSHHFWRSANDFGQEITN